jgi:hypothetical protein
VALIAVDAIAAIALVAAPVAIPSLRVHPVADRVKATYAATRKPEITPISNRAPETAGLMHEF